MTSRHFGALVLAALLAARGELGAQAQAAVEAPRRAAASRVQMERNLRQALWRATKTRVGLSDEQMTRLEAATRALEPRRAALLRREREARRDLRLALADAQPDQPRVARQLDEIQSVQRGRVELHAEEQRRLAEFMTPVQRARYVALQEQFRRRVEQLRRPPGGRPGPDSAEGLPLRRRRP